MARAGPIPAAGPGPIPAAGAGPIPAAGPVLPPNTRQIIIAYFIDRLREAADSSATLPFQLQNIIRAELLAGGAAEPTGFNQYIIILLRLSLYIRRVAVPGQLPANVNSHLQPTIARMEQSITNAFATYYNTTPGGTKSWSLVAFLLDVAGQAVVESALFQPNMNRCAAILIYTENFFNTVWLSVDNQTLSTWIQNNGWPSLLTEINTLLANGITIPSHPTREATIDSLSAAPCSSCGSARLPTRKCPSIGCRSVECAIPSCNYTTAQGPNRMREHFTAMHTTPGLVNNCACGEYKHRGPETSGQCWNCGRYQCWIGTCEFEHDEKRLPAHFTSCHPGQTANEPEIDKSDLCSCGGVRDPHGECMLCRQFTCIACGSMHTQKGNLFAHYRLFGH